MLKHAFNLVIIINKNLNRYKRGDDYNDEKREGSKK